MVKVTIETYKESKHYNRIVEIINATLDKQLFISPVIVFTELGMISKLEIEDWKKGKIEYFERAIKCNLNQANNILKIISFHAHDLNLIKSITVYIKKNKEILKFTKTGDPILEKSYATHFVKKIQKKCLTTSSS